MTGKRPLPPVGTIVRLSPDGQFDPCWRWAVVVNSLSDRHGDYAFTRVLEPNARTMKVYAFGGWYIDDTDHPWAYVHPDNVPDEIYRLATICLLDPTFVPFREEAENIVNRGSAK